MTSEQLLTHDELDDILATNNLDIQASELQGMICGLFSAGMPNDGKSWKIPVIDRINEGQLLAAKDMEQLDRYVRAMGGTLETSLFELELALPDDVASIAERIASASKWCEGFLLGYGLQVQDQRLNSDDLQEALKDLSEISQVDLDVDESEEMEQALTTVLEHVRVTAQVVYIETRGQLIQAAEEANRPGTKLH